MSRPAAPAPARPRPGRTLRARLAVAYTLLTLALTGLLGALAYLGLSAALERRVGQELETNALALEARFNDPVAALREPPAISKGLYFQLLDVDGTSVARSANLSGLDLPARAGLNTGGRESLWVARFPWRRGGTRVGTIAVALDASDLVRVRRLALVTLGALALLATALALPLGFALGGRTLRRLELAAERAARVDPADPRPLGLDGPNDDEAGALVEALDRTLGRIRERQQRERGFLAEVAHELGTPLTVLTGRLESMAAETGDERLAAARDAAIDIARTAEDLLLLARGELEPVLDRYLLDLREIAGAVKREVPDARLRLVLPPQPLEVIGDPHRLRQVARNLARNALRAARSRVRLEVRRDGATALLEVSDDGPGIRPEDLGLIFERFYSRSGGSGVGLAVVRQVARAHGGDAEAGRGPEGGACFTVRLPVADLGPDASAERATEAPGITAAPEPGITAAPEPGITAAPEPGITAAPGTVAEVAAVQAPRG